jgi:hypothetical protein
MKIPKPLIISLILVAACTSIASAKVVEFNLMTEEPTTGKIYLTLSRDYAGNRNDVLLEQELKQGLNRIEINDDLLESNVFFEMDANGFKKDQGSLQELMERIESNKTLKEKFGQEFPIMLFREKEILVEYVISEDGRTFDKTDTVRGEVWISDSEMWLPEKPIPIVEEDFQLNIVATMVMISYHRTQKGYGVFSR